MFVTGERIDSNYKYGGWLTGNEFWKSLIDSEEQYSLLPEFYDLYSDYLEQVNIDKMSRWEKQDFYKRWYKNYKPCDLASDYLVVCKDSNPKSDFTCYTESTLRRKNYDPSLRTVKRHGKDHRTKDYKTWLAAQKVDKILLPSEDETEKRPRSHNVTSITGIMPHDVEDLFEGFSDYDYAIYQAVNRRVFNHENNSLGGKFIQCVDSDYLDNSAEGEALNKIEIEETRELLTDPLELKIFDMLIDGYRDVEIYEALELSKGKFYRVVDKMRKRLRQTDTEDVSQSRKLCGKCKKLIGINSFGVDKRNKDGRQSICKPCDAERKKKKA